MSTNISMVQTGKSQLSMDEALRSRKDSFVRDEDADLGVCIARALKCSMITVTWRVWRTYKRVEPGQAGTVRSQKDNKGGGGGGGGEEKENIDEWSTLCLRCVF